MDVTIEIATGEDLAWIQYYLGNQWGAPLIISRLVRHRAEQLPALVAWHDGDPVGLLTYSLDATEFEVVTIDVTQRRRGIGRALMTAAIELARESGCQRLWLVTTNENTGGMAFHRTMGLEQVAVRRGAVDLARRLKPTIPRVWKGVRVSDEHEFELVLRPAALTEGLADRVGAALGSPVASWRAVRGGYTPSERIVVRLRDGRSAFVKAPRAAEHAAWIRAELGMYARGLDCMPRLLYGDDGPDALLILEDLSDAHWPPQWRPGDVAAVRASLAHIAAQDAAGLPALADRPQWRNQWRAIRDDPAAFLRLGMCPHDWFEAHVEAFIEAEAAAVLAGETLGHFDVRSDNICLRDGKALIVDWNWAGAAHPDVDLAFWAPSLEAEGGPPPEHLLPHAPGLAATVAGFFARCAGLPDIPSAPRVRGIQQVQLTTALPWLARAVGVPPPR